MSALDPNTESLQRLIDRLESGEGGAVDAAEHLADMITPRPLDEWNEDDGSVLWWTWQDGRWLGEPAYIGCPNCEDWPEYHTHWTPHPSFPRAPKTP